MKYISILLNKMQVIIHTLCPFNRLDTTYSRVKTSECKYQILRKLLEKKFPIRKEKKKKRNSLSLI